MKLTVQELALLLEWFDIIDAEWGVSDQESIDLSNKIIIEKREIEENNKLKRI